MADNTNNRITRMLLSKSRRAQYARVFAVLAACVVIAVVVVLHQSGIAMTHEERVLTCPLTDVVTHTHNEDCYDADGNLVCTLPVLVLHTHNEDCYDADGNLVCTLPELEPHTHTDDCYAEVRELTCGLEESKDHVHTDDCYTVTRTLTCGREEIEPHTHTDDCYTEVRELTCGLEESKDHVHTDDCYTVTRTLTCGKKEVLGEHVHGPGCFTTVTVQDEEEQNDEQPSDAENNVTEGEAKVAMPAQEFEGEILDENGKLWVRVSVKAPEGAFPANTTMKIEPLDAEGLRTKVEDALKKDDVRVTGAKQMKAVDIKFFDAEGNEIEPAVDVEVKLTSDTVRDIEEPVLVHVDKDETKDAEVLKKVDVVNQDEDNKTKGTEDTLKFESNAFSPYVIVDPRVITAQVITASGDTYSVTVSYGEDAGIPDDATLSAVEIKEGEESYNTLAAQTTEAVDTDAESVETLRLFDICIKDAKGNILEPTAHVEVKIALVGEDISKNSELKVVHFDKEGAEVIDPTIEGDSGTADVVTFVTDSFSIYSVVTWKPSETGDNSLGGKSFAIVHVSEATVDSNEMWENKKRHIGQAMKDSQGKSENYRWVEANNVVVEGHKSGTNIVTSNASGENDPQSNTAITKWTFEATSGGKYYIKAGDQYLRLESNSNVTPKQLKLVGRQYATACVVEIDEGAHAGMIRISDGNNNFVWSSVNANSNTNKKDNNTPAVGFFVNSQDDNHCWLTLCEIQEEIANNPESTYNAAVYKGKKVSASQLQDGHKYIVYRTEYNQATGTYEDYAIDGNGNLIKAYDKGDVLTFHGTTSPVWTFDVLKNASGNPNGYYIFRNAKGAIEGTNENTTGKILHPTANTKVKDLEDNSSSVDGVRMTGREGSKYNSTIEFWDSDSSAMRSYGYKLVWDEELMDFVLGTGFGDDSQEFMFAEVIETEPAGALHEVATVDSAAQGITIHMFNYPSQATISNVTGSDGWGQGVLQQNYVLPTLHKDPNSTRTGTVNNVDLDGYPRYSNNDDCWTYDDNGHHYWGKYGEILYSPSNGYHVGTANHLFLQSVYDATGYYEYSCFNNFAQYDAATGNFKVYAELGAPQSYDNERHYKAINQDDSYVKVNPNDFNMKRGNFMPFNELDTSNTDHNSNLFNGSGELLDYEDPMYGVPVYRLEGSPDFYFGMTMDFNFLMPPDGLVNGEPMQYEFNGDDDLLVYVDGVLLLNIDGRHDAWPGTINFHTGQITCPGRDDTTIKECFQKAGVYPDGTPWGDGRRANEFFKGNTFIDYSGHSFKMFYNEHGAYASNLMMRFNLPTIKSGQVTVEKQLTNAQASYANATFDYKLWVEDGNNTNKLVSAASMYNPVYEGTTNPVAVDSNGVFHLKPGEAAVFSGIPENRKYYVQELNVDSDVYTVYINNKQTGVLNGTTGTYQSTTDTVRIRPRVVYKNEAKEAGVNDLHITKLLASGTPATNDTFEFRVLMENKSGDLVAYNGEYCIWDEENQKYYTYDGQLHDDPIMYTSGQYGTIERIPAGKTVIISGLLEGTDFFVDEIRMRPNDSEPSVLIGNSEWTLVSRVCDSNNQGPVEISNANIYDYATGQTVSGQSSLGSIAKDKNAHVTFTNELNMTEVWLKKVNENGATLNGATFALTRWNDTNANASTWESITPSIKPGVEVQSNPISLGKLRKGIYRLEETDAPSGYTITDNKYTYFKVDARSETDRTLVVSLLTTSPDGAVITSSAYVSLDTKNSENDMVVVKNIPGKELPATGGTGTTAIYATGVLLVGVAAFGLVSKKMRNNL